MAIGRNLLAAALLLFVAASAGCQHRPVRILTDLPEPLTIPSAVVKAPAAAPPCPAEVNGDGLTLMAPASPCLPPAASDCPWMPDVREKAWRIS